MCVCFPLSLPYIIHMVECILSTMYHTYPSFSCDFAKTASCPESLEDLYFSLNRNASEKHAAHSPFRHSTTRVSAPGNSRARRVRSVRCREHVPHNQLIACASRRSRSPLQFEIDCFVFAILNARKQKA